MRPIRILGGILVVASSLRCTAPSEQEFTGTITDSMCAEADHSRMRMGSTSAECTIACIDAHGARYVLYDGKDTYNLSDQQRPEKFAGRKVTITGTLDARTKTIVEIGDVHQFHQN
jgi:hypothetical protein